MTDRIDIEIVGDLAGLPDSASGPSHLVWWGNIGFMLIEGTGFALAAAAYLYLKTQAPTWPPAGDALPGLLWSGLFTGGLFLSALPNIYVLHCAKSKNLAGVRWGTLAMAVLGMALLVPRAFEFSHLGVAWYTDAYGSAVWLLLVLHTSHVVTDLGDTIVLGAWLFTHDVGDDQLADVEDNANYWSFIVLCWLPIYGLIYWLPRLG
jgi:heme/copper-type cytochrome/quinol oxidase subunit 3